MSETPEPADALSPEAFYSLYLGGLAVEDESDRTELCYTLLVLGRLGLTPSELLHLHEGWIDWERGTVHVPARDPCACGDCWDRARQLQRQGDDRPLETIVARECWSEGETSARALAFGWSRRLTAAIDGVVTAETHLTSNIETVREQVATAARRARLLDSSAVSITALRASALTFLAAAGFGPRRLADLTGVDEETAGAFARVGGGEARSHLYRVLANVDVPTLCEGDTPYRLICDPVAFEREPFDPTEYDAAWRRERARQSEPSEYNPRPISPPSDVSFGEEDLPRVSEPAGQHGPGIVAESLAEWADQPDWNRPTTTDRTDEPSTTGSNQETGSPEQSVTDRSQPERATQSSEEPTVHTEPAGPSAVTEPVAFSVDTRFVAPGFEGGRPTGGSILLGQDELRFLSREASGVTDSLRVDLDWIVNLSPGYVPDPLEGLFEDTVAVAYHDENDERRVVVAEIPSDARWQFVQLVLASILDGEPTVVAHQPGAPDTTDVYERQMNATKERLRLDDTEGDRPPLRLHLDQLVDIEQGYMTTADEYESGLTVTNLRASGDLVRTELRPIAETKLRILAQYFTHFDDRQTARAEEVTLSGEERQLLERLLDKGGGRDVLATLDADRETLSAAMDRLVERGLVLDRPSGKRLSGAAYRLVSPDFEL